MANKKNNLKICLKIFNNAIKHAFKEQHNVQFLDHWLWKESKLGQKSFEKCFDIFGQSIWPEYFMGGVLKMFYVYYFLLPLGA